MKTFHFLGCMRFFVNLALVASLQVQANEMAPILGLPRLKSSATADGTVPPLAAASFAMDELLPSSVIGAGNEKKNGIDYLTLDGGKAWSRPLRGGGNRPVYISILVLGSQSTVIEIVGARLGLTASLADDSLQLMYDDVSGAEPQWRSLGIYLPLEKHDGRAFGAAPVLTVQIEPDFGVWHLFAGTRLLAYGLPLLPRADAKISVKSGRDGALICGLVQSDENPLFVDGNANGIDDTFETQAHGGSLLPSNGTIEQRTATVLAWKAAQKNKSPSALSYARLSADRS